MVISDQCSKCFSWHGCNCAFLPAKMWVGASSFEIYLNSNKDSIMPLIDHSMIPKQNKDSTVTLNEEIKALNEKIGLLSEEIKSLKMKMIRAKVGIEYLEKFSPSSRDDLLKSVLKDLDW